ncbi:FMN-dependent NADH-azoreductase [Mucilaginibacter pocheonensis]|uniref:FMN dependent NADH:quinone oxidoreductase n=1 Tax=Mucilaginibacter pocheonensis TaxID=398050 RepID=A0ABU1TEN9_9SPHI|nr:NAD(P)H-dependent oxidoreductase [Mucilaginibacter pocheonensis]MDR6943736.1 FMN-dependent NADH-azoreductase [Mucilaginibacter pocheonensis]
MNLLIINSSPRTICSHTRRLTGIFASYWLMINPGSKITYRDLGQEKVPHISEQWISGAFKEPESRSADEVNALALSDGYIKELREAEVIVIGVPMYNFSIPSSLKAYLDQVIRINETWILDRGNTRNPYIGLLREKKIILIQSRGAVAYDKGGYYHHLDFQSTYLKAIFAMIGITDIQEVTVNGELTDGNELVRSLECAMDEIRSIVESLEISCVE